MENENSLDFQAKRYFRQEGQLVIDRFIDKVEKRVNILNATFLIFQLVIFYFVIFKFTSRPTIQVIVISFSIIFWSLGYGYAFQFNRFREFVNNLYCTVALFMSIKVEGLRPIAICGKSWLGSLARLKVRRANLNKSERETFYSLMLEWEGSLSSLLKCATKL